MNRRAKHEALYTKYRKTHDSGTDTCVLCELKHTKIDKIVREYNSAYLVHNKFPYDMWDSSPVDEHLMLVPKRHVVSLSELAGDERDDYFKALTDLEKDGYSVYARAPSDITKSIAHQHTHFIKLVPKRYKLVVYLRRPHFLLFR